MRISREGRDVRRGRGHEDDHAPEGGRCWHGVAEDGRRRLKAPIEAPGICSLALELDDPSKAQSITPFQGDSLGLEEASAVKQDALLTYRSIFDQLSNSDGRLRRARRR